MRDRQQERLEREQTLLDRAANKVAGVKEHLKAFEEVKNVQITVKPVVNDRMRFVEVVVDVPDLGKLSYSLRLELTDVRSSLDESQVYTSVRGHEQTKSLKFSTKKDSWNCEKLAEAIYSATVEKLKDRAQLEFFANKKSANMDAVRKLNSKVLGDDTGFFHGFRYYGNAYFQFEPLVSGASIKVSVEVDPASEKAEEFLIELRNLLDKHGYGKE